MKQFKKYTAEATKDIRENIVEPLEEAKRPLKEAMEPINDLNKEINKNVNGDVYKRQVKIVYNKKEQIKSDQLKTSKRGACREQAESCLLYTSRCV